MYRFYLTVLSQPFPAYSPNKKQILICIIIGVAVFLMLYLLEPFNINLLSARQKLHYVTTYSSIALFTCILCSVVGPWIMPGFFQESKWTVLKEIMYLIFILTLISFFNLIAHNIIDSTPLTFWEFLVSLAYTIPVAAFPVSFSVLVKQKWLKEKYKKEAALWTSMLQGYQNKGLIEYKEAHINDATANQMSVPKNKEAIAITPEIITLTGTGVGEIVDIKADNLLFISSADNYITVHYAAEQTTKTAILRNTLKNTEAKTQQFEAIVRCHRSYIVNLNKVERIVGDTQGLKLLIKGVTEPIFVGKSYLDTVKNLLQNIKPINAVSNSA